MNASAQRSSSPAATSSNRCSLPVLRSAGRLYSIADVLAFKRWHGRARDSTDRPAPLANSGPLLQQRDAELSEDALESALADFRYTRDLVSAAECDAWLAKRGLRYADLVESVRRQGTGALAAEREVDYLLSTAFANDAWLLARHVCTALTHGLALPEPNEPLEPHLAKYACAYAQECAAVLHDDARNRRLRIMQRRLSKIEFVCAEFDSLDAALEARLCVQHDGLTLADLSAEHGFVCTRAAQRRESIAEDWQMALDGATAGRLALPIKQPPRYLLLQPLRTIAANLSDTPVAQRIDSSLLNEHFGPQLAQNIRWELDLNAAHD